MAIALFVVGCYDAPKPQCGFRCGPAQACPEGYACGADNRCRAEGAPDDLLCATPDGGPTADAYSPNATLSYPLPGTELNPSDAIQVEFDVHVENVNAATFTVTTSAGMVAGTVAYDAQQSRAAFYTDTGFPENTALTVNLDDAIVDPASGRGLRPTTFQIMTGDDTTPPTIEQIVPGDDATGVSVDANVTVRFTERVIAVSTSSFTLTEGGTPVGGSVTYDPQTRTAIFDPTDQLAPNTAYTPRLSGAIMDLSNNVLAGAPVMWNFTTGADAVAPTIRTQAPLANMTGVPVSSTVVIVFDEPVMNATTASVQLNGGAIAGTVTTSNGNRTVTFDPTADLPAATTIDVTLSTAITDTSSNAFAGAAFSFTTN